MLENDDDYGNDYGDSDEEEESPSSPGGKKA
jgi:hypothetical protein